MTDLLKQKGYFIPTSYRLYGDVVLSAPLKRTAQGLIQKMENAGLSAWRLRVMDADIHIQRLKGHNIVSITKVGGEDKRTVIGWAPHYNVTDAGVHYRGAYDEASKVNLDVLHRIPAKYMRPETYDNILWPIQSKVVSSRTVITTSVVDIGVVSQYNYWFYEPTAICLVYVHEWWGMRTSDYQAVTRYYLGNPDNPYWSIDVISHNKDITFALANTAYLAQWLFGDSQYWDNKYPNLSFEYQRTWGDYWDPWTMGGFGPYGGGGWADDPLHTYNIQEGHAIGCPPTKLLKDDEVIDVLAPSWVSTKLVPGSADIPDTFGFYYYDYIDIYRHCTAFTGGETRNPWANSWGADDYRRMDVDWHRVIKPSNRSVIDDEISGASTEGGTSAWTGTLAEPSMASAYSCDKLVDSAGKKEPYDPILAAHFLGPIDPAQDPRVWPPDRVTINKAKYTYVDTDNLVKDREYACDAQGFHMIDNAVPGFPEMYAFGFMDILISEEDVTI
ncbi:MAG: hypothetical protein A4E65_00805 [Syntrophorhabdus sp. PtaU1.Bin153]|nr:MAG: hypothetical protein A4E65_00805 [Syntrophorhabdus sp. PtaU1.Bin153]